MTTAKGDIDLVTYWRGSINLPDLCSHETTGNFIPYYCDGCALTANNLHYGSIVYSGNISVWNGGWCILLPEYLLLRSNVTEKSSLRFRALCWRKNLHQHTDISQCQHIYWLIKSPIDLRFPHWFWPFSSESIRSN